MLSIYLANDLDLLTQKLGCQTKFSENFSKYVVDVNKRLKWTVKKSNCGSGFSCTEPFYRLGIL